MNYPRNTRMTRNSKSSRLHHGVTEIPRKTEYSDSFPRITRMARNLVHHEDTEIPRSSKSLEP